MARFARAWESADLDALVALLTGDVFIAMPPVPFGYQGRDAVTRYCASLFAAGRRFDLVPARANGQPAFGAYLRSPAGIRHATAFYVLTLAGGQICAITRFEASVLPWFGLPRSLPSRYAGLRAVKVSSRENTPWRICHCGPAECGRPGMRTGTSAGPLLIPRTQHVPQVGSGPGRRCGTRRNGQQPDRRRPAFPGSGRLPAERAPDRPLIGRIRPGTSGPSAACPWSRSSIRADRRPHPLNGHSSRRSPTSTASDLSHRLDGLTEEQARRSLVPSRTTLLGLVKHAASPRRSGSTKPSPPAAQRSARKRLICVR